MGNIPDKYTSVNSDGKFLLPDSDSMWKQYPIEDTDGSPRFDGQFPDGQPTQWERFHRAVEHPTLVKPYQNLEPDPNNVTTYDASNPMVYNVTALTTGNTDTQVTMRKYTPLEPGYWKFSTDTMPLWKWRIHCPYFDGKSNGLSVQPDKTTVCFLDAATSEVSLLGDMPDYAKNAWVFSLQSDDGNDQDVNAGSAVDVTHTRNYYPGTLRVASTNVGKIASSQPKFYLYTGNDATQASLNDTSHWVELVKGEEVETWPAYKKWASDIEPDVLYEVTGDHRVVESTQDYSPVPITVDETQHIALKVAVTPITNSTLPSAGGMGTTWKIVGIITLIAALFLAIVALLKKRAMQ